MKPAPLLIAVLAFALPDLAAQNIVVNGDFAEPVVAALSDYNHNGYRIYYGTATFPGWTVGGHSVDIVTDAEATLYGNGWEPASGHQSIDLNGSGPGSIHQPLAT